MRVCICADRQMRNFEMGIDTDLMLRSLSQSILTGSNSNCAIGKFWSFPSLYLLTTYLSMCVFTSCLSTKGVRSGGCDEELLCKGMS